jgi:hypothetical protein
VDPLLEALCIRFRDGFGWPQHRVCHLSFRGGIRPHQGDDYGGQLRRQQCRTDTICRRHRNAGAYTDPIAGEMEIEIIVTFPEGVIPLILPDFEQ